MKTFGKFFVWLVTWGGRGEGLIHKHIRAAISMAILFLIIVWMMGAFSSCQKIENPEKDKTNYSFVNPDGFNAKKGGKGKKNNVPPILVDQLPPIFYGDIDIQWTTNGNGSVITWDAMPNANGYQIMIYDNCYCYTTQVDSIAIPGETYYLKYLNATNEEAWMGYLNEIGKDRWYQIRIRSWALVGTDWQPYISDMDSIYVD